MATKVHKSLKEKKLWNMANFVSSVSHWSWNFHCRSHVHQVRSRGKHHRANHWHWQMTPSLWMDASCFFCHSWQTSKPSKLDWQPNWKSKTMKVSKPLPNQGKGLSMICARGYQLCTMSPLVWCNKNDNLQFLMLQVLHWWKSLQQVPWWKYFVL